MLPDADPLLASGPFAHRYVQAHGARFHAVTAGLAADATPRRLVVLAHSYPQHWYAWRGVLAQADALGVAMVAIDLRGYGASDKPPGRFAAQTLAADILGVTSALGAPEAIVVGHGLGGAVARAAAALGPDVIRHVVAVASPDPATWRLPHTPAAARWLAYAQVPWLPERGHTHGNTVARFMTEMCAPGSPALTSIESYTNALRSPFAAHSAMEQVRWLVRSRRRPSGRQFLAQAARAHAATPITELRGASDRFWTASAPSDPVQVVPGGFFLPEENPGAVLTAIDAATSSFS